MSILIRGMSMPKSCRFCPCCRYEYDRQHAEEYHICNLLPYGAMHNANIRQKDCPLIEVPTPHGRLIDANELENLIVDEFDGVCTYDVSPDEAVSDFQSIIDECKTIIKTEE